MEGADSAPPPSSQVENVLNRPGEIGLIGSCFVQGGLGPFRTLDFLPRGIAIVSCSGMEILPSQKKSPGDVNSWN